MACAAHDRLCAGQFDAGIVALAEGAVAVTGQDIADVAQAHGAVGLGVAAASDVEVEHARRLVEHLDRERVVLRPQVQDRLEAFEVGAARRAPPISAPASIAARQIALRRISRVFASPIALRISS